ncbi:MAG: hypothetical protein V4505_14015 [Pseudomonadota bacterium]
MATIQGKVIQSVFPFQMNISNSGQVSTFGTRPVFRLTFDDGTQRVLKAELVNDPGHEAKVMKTAKFIGDLHSGVSTDLDIQPFSKQDEAELKTITPEQIERDTQKATVSGYLADLVDSKMFVFYTMVLFKLKDLDGKLKSTEKKREGGEEDMTKLGAYKLAKRMCTDTQLLVELGKVIAVDLFSDNKDRFDKDGRVVNAGNIMFRKNLDKTYTPVGVDFFDAQNSNAQMYAPLARPEDWGGTILVDHGKIDVFASKAIMSLNAALGAAIAPHVMPAEALMGGVEVKNLARGLASGAEELRRMLLNRQKTRGVPSGVSSRMALLGWDGTGWQSSTGQHQTGGGLHIGTRTRSTHVLPLPQPSSSSSTGWVTATKPNHNGWKIGKPGQ